MQVNRTKIQGKHAEPSTADTTAKEMKATYSTNIAAQIQ
jgi:hypothetical protein